jgi:hypothetical protein
LPWSDFESKMEPTVVDQLVVPSLFVMFTSFTHNYYARVELFTGTNLPDYIKSKLGGKKLYNIRQWSHTKKTFF